MNKNYYEKYLKYKTKYSSLKKQSDTMVGGMGCYNSSLFDHPNFSSINEIAKKKVILLKECEGEQYQLYSPLLDNLLKKVDGVINMDFISDFNRQIYYDFNGTELGIKIENKATAAAAAATDYEYTWINDANNIYKISKERKPIKQPNTTIIFLELKDAYIAPDQNINQKVLKIFDSIAVTENFIKDYLSLEVTKIGNETTKRTPQQNYGVYNHDDFTTINFNMVTKFIATENKNDIYLSCRNNDAINEYIINLILQKINETTPINFVKYDNFFVTKIDNVLKYCILMDMYSGSLDTYINKLPQNSYVAIHDVLQKTEIELNKLKTMEYLFTHTDMKLENIFYKIDNDAIIPYLADFDKSSITFHNIRFYNDIRSSSSIKGLTADDIGINQLFIDKYTIDNKKEREIKFYSLNTEDIDIKVDDDDDFIELTNRSDVAPAAAASDRIDSSIVGGFKFKIPSWLLGRTSETSAANSYDESNEDTKPFKYRLSRIGGNVIAKVTDGFIESEQTYMRYNITPFYTSFDMCSLLCSLFSKSKFKQLLEKSVHKDEKELFNFVTTYIDKDSLQLIINDYTATPIPPQYIGNFGYLLNILYIQKEYLGDYFIHKFHKIKNEPPPFINKLYITNQNKIAISIPFIPIAISVTPDNKLSTNFTMFTLAKKLTKDKYNMYKLLNDDSNSIIGKLEYITSNSFKIEYNNDFAIGITALVNEIGLIVKTNRYSSKHFNIFARCQTTNRVYDYDTIREDELNKIYNFFISIANKI